MIAPQLMTSARTGTGSDSWCTPTNVLDLVRKVAPIYLDPCWNKDALTFPVVRYTEEDDGLSQIWRCPPGSLAFVNDPYSNHAPWLEKCRRDWSLGFNDCTIALVPARTDTRPWHSAQPLAICFWKGRIIFLEDGKPRLDKKTGKPVGAPFPSALLCWARGEMLDRFCAAFASAGMVVRL